MAGPYPEGVPGAASILVVDDDPTVADVVVRYLEHAGYDVRQVADGPSALTAAASQSFDLIVLDVMLPGLDGLEVCRRLRLSSAVSIIMLTAKGDETDRIVGLEVGADDYLSKPFSPRELLLRIQSVLRRSAGGVSRPEPVAVRCGSLVVDVAARQAERDGRPLHLTVREFDLLAFFVAHPRQAFDRAELLERVWGWTFGDHSTVTVHVRRLREKIEEDPTVPTRLVTLWGVGYRWDAPCTVAEPA